MTEANTINMEELYYNLQRFRANRFRTINPPTPDGGSSRNWPAWASAPSDMDLSRLTFIAYLPSKRWRVYVTFADMERRSRLYCAS